MSCEGLPQTHILPGFLCKYVDSPGTTAIKNQSGGERTKINTAYRELLPSQKKKKTIQQILGETVNNYHTEKLIKDLKRPTNSGNGFNLNSDERYWNAKEGDRPTFTY